MVKSILGAIFSWGGIFGAALTILSNLQGVLDLTKWARFIVQAWAGWVQIAWDTLQIGLPIEFGTPERFQLTMAGLTLMLGIGSRIQHSMSNTNGSHWPISGSNVFRWNVLFGVALYAIPPVTFVWLVESGLVTITSNPEAQIWRAVLLAFYFAAIATGLLHWQLPYALAVALACVIISYIMIWIPVSSLPASDEPRGWQATQIIAMMIVVGVGMIVLWLAPPREMTLRTWGIIFAFFTIALLNEVSKLNLDLTPPTAQ